MIQKIKRLLFIGVVGLLFAHPAPLLWAAGSDKVSNPDFTKGGKVPAGVSHFWNLGATGARGWMYSDKLCTIDARQIAITQVAKGSPADGVLAVGDVILGVGGRPFSYDPRTEFGKALTLADASGKLSLIRWRAGKQSNVVVKMPVLGTYSATAPFNCPKSKRILESGCEALAKRIADPKYRMGTIPRSLNALALLASGNRKYFPILKKEAQWASEFKAKGMATWFYGYVNIFLSEYVMATCVDLSGAKYPETYKGNKIIPMAGKSLRPLFKGKTFSRENPIYFNLGSHRAMRKGKWKLVSARGGPWELYDMRTDRTELNNLAAELPDKVKELSTLYDAWSDQCSVTTTNR